MGSAPRRHRTSSTTALGRPSTRIVRRRPLAGPGAVPRFVVCRRLCAIRTSWWPYPNWMPKVPRWFCASVWSGTNPVTRSRFAGSTGTGWGICLWRTFGTGCIHPEGIARATDRFRGRIKPDQRDRRLSFRLMASPPGRFFSSCLTAPTAVLILAPEPAKAGTPNPVESCPIAFGVPALAGSWRPMAKTRTAAAPNSQIAVLASSAQLFALEAGWAGTRIRCVDTNRRGRCGATSRHQRARPFS